MTDGAGRWRSAERKTSTLPAAGQLEGDGRQLHGQSCLISQLVFYVLMCLSRRGRGSHVLLCLLGLIVVIYSQLTCQEGIRDAGHACQVPISPRPPFFLSFSASYHPVLWRTLNSLVKDKRLVQLAKALYSTEL